VTAEAAVVSPWLTWHGGHGLAPRSLDALTGRRGDGQPIGYAFLEPDFEFVGFRRARDAIRRRHA